jgi:hypothetical protein
MFCCFESLDHATAYTRKDLLYIKTGIDSDKLSESNLVLVLFEII